MSKLISIEQQTGERPRFVVWHAQNLPSTMLRYSVESPDEARTLISNLIREDLDDHSIESNAFGLEELEGNEYYEWYNDEDQDIMAIVDGEES